MAFELKQILGNLKFNIEFGQNFVIYRKKFKTRLFGELWIDIFEGKQFENKIEVVMDCEPIKILPLTEENIKMVVAELQKLEIK